MFDLLFNHPLIVKNHLVFAMELYFRIRQISRKIHEFGELLLRMLSLRHNHSIGLLLGKILQEFYVAADRTNILLGHQWISSARYEFMSHYLRSLPALSQILLDVRLVFEVVEEVFQLLGIVVRDDHVEDVFDVCLLVVVLQIVDAFLKGDHLVVFLPKHFHQLHETDDIIELRPAECHILSHLQLGLLPLTFQIYLGHILTLLSSLFLPQLLLPFGLLLRFGDNVARSLAECTSFDEVGALESVTSFMVLDEAHLLVLYQDRIIQIGIVGAEWVLHAGLTFEVFVQLVLYVLRVYSVLLIVAKAAHFLDLFH